MKYAPEYIFLRVGADAQPEDDFNDIDPESISWSDCRIDDSDIEYVLSSNAESEIERLRKALASSKIEISRLENIIALKK